MRALTGEGDGKTTTTMRIATWNVNSLKARMEKLLWWLERAQPDVLLLQETKLVDAEAKIPRVIFEKAGYELAHHGEGRWNGVAIASRVGLSDVLMNFGEPERIASRKAASDNAPLDEARMISAVVSGKQGEQGQQGEENQIRIVCLYAPNGRTVGSPSYVAKLGWYEHLTRWVETTRRTDERLIVGGDMNIAPDDRDVWDAAAAHGGTHVSKEERDAYARLCQWGLFDSYRKHHDAGERYTWWDYRAGDFYKNFGMRIDHLLVTAPLTERIVQTEIDREARKGKPTPSDHAPFILDLDEVGRPFDAGWAGADDRIAARRKQRAK